MLPRPPTATDQPVALFLDFDGTLVEIAPRPGDVVVSDALRSLLKSLHATLDGALAVVSGRQLQDLLGHLAPLVVPAVGSHGLDYQLRPGELHVTSDACLPDAFWQAVEAFVRARPGLLLEHKGHGAAVHYRQAPELGAEVQAQLDQLRQRDAPGFQLQAGKMVWELRPAGVNKGTAIDRILEDPPFADRLPIFVGDDLTDEDAFRVINERGGWTIHVGDGSSPTAAQLGLADVSAVGQWLQQLNIDLSRHCA